MKYFYKVAGSAITIKTVPKKQNPGRDAIVNAGIGSTGLAVGVVANRQVKKIIKSNEKLLKNSKDLERFIRRNPGHKNIPKAHAAMNLNRQGIVKNFRTGVKLIGARNAGAVVAAIGGINAVKSGNKYLSRKK